MTGTVRRGRPHLRTFSTGWSDCGRSRASPGYMKRARPPGPGRRQDGSAHDPIQRSGWQSRSHRSRACFGSSNRHSLSAGRIAARFRRFARRRNPLRAKTPTAASRMRARFRSPIPGPFVFVDLVLRGVGMIPQASIGASISGCTGAPRARSKWPVSRQLATEIKSAKS